MEPAASIERNEGRLTWIFGSSRSGSTWLLRMLSEVPGVVPIDDPHLGHHLGVWRPIPLAWAASSEPPPALTTLLELKREQEGYFFAERYRDAWWEPLKALIRARFEAQAEAHPATGAEAVTYIVKEPGSQVARLLMELFPGSKLVFLLRDGRDVVDSWLDAHRHHSWAIPEGAFAVAPWGRLALIRWLSTVWVFRTEEVRRAFCERGPAGRAFVRYEDLLARTPAVLAEVCRALGIDAEPRLLEEVAERHSFEQVPEGERGYGMEVRAARPGAWRNHLSPEEQLAMHTIMGPTLGELGYLEEEREAEMIS